MTGFLSAVKADLLDRRLLPLVALVGCALLGALAYVVLSGSSGSSPAASAVTAGPNASGSGLAISHTTPETAVAEVTSGAATQHRGNAHDPFVPLPNPAEDKAKSASSETTSSSSSSSSGSSATSESTSPSSSSTSESTATTPAKPSTPAKPKTVYHVAVLFGEIPPAGSSATAQLTPYENLKLLTPLPSAKQALVVFRGVTAGGKSATFTLVGEAILHGKAACLPNPSQCEAIDLHSGESEILEYLTPAGQTVSYELTLVTITSTKASSADVASELHGESKAGRALLRNDGLLALPYLRSSSQVGVLVFAGRPAFAHQASRAGAQR